MINQDELKYLIREFSDRSIQWLLETPDNVRGLLLAIAPDLAKHIDYSQLKRLNRTFILDDFQKREADMIFEASFLDESGLVPKDVIIYILIESQSSVDPTMPFRLLFYMTHIWNMQRQWLKASSTPAHQWKFHPILPMVFYTGLQKWDFPSDMRKIIELPDSLEKFVPQYEILFLNLNAIEPEKLTQEDHPFGWILRIIQKEKSDKENFKKALQLAIQHIDKMPLHEKANWEKLIHFIFAFINHRREQEEQSELMDTVKNSIMENSKKEEIENMGKTIAQFLIEEGEKKGLQQGLQQGLEQGLQQGFQQGEEKGKKDGLLEAISLGLEIKFGATSLSLLEKVLKINSLEKLEVIKEAIRLLDSIDDIEKLL